MPEQQGWLVKRDQNGTTTYYNPTAAAVAPMGFNREVKFRATGRHSTFEYHGPDGSRTTDRALDLATRVAMSKCKCFFAEPLLLGPVDKS